MHFDADQQLQDFIQKKVDKLETFYDRIVEGEVILRHNNKDGVDNNTVEIKLFVPGATLFSEADSTSFEASTDEAVENMRRQLKRHKDKQLAH